MRPQMPRCWRVREFMRMKTPRQPPLFQRLPTSFPASLAPANSDVGWSEVAVKDADRVADRTVDRRQRQRGAPMAKATFL